MASASDMSRHVSKKLRPHFVQAFEGTYGWWFEFDGTVRFRDPKGGGSLPFAYGRTVADCKAMMKCVISEPPPPAGVGKAGELLRKARR